MTDVISKLSQPPNAANASDRRSGADRRRGGWPALWNSLYRRRRRGLRRPEDTGTPGYYLDTLSPSIRTAAAIIAVCCCMDVIFTLWLLKHGATEVNPLMRELLEIHTGLFIGVKFAITAFAVLILASHAHFQLLNVMRARHALYGAAAGYLALNTYQLILMAL